MSAKLAVMVDLDRIYEVAAEQERLHPWGTQKVYESDQCPEVMAIRTFTQTCTPRVVMALVDEIRRLRHEAGL